MKTSEMTGAALDWAVEFALLADRIKNVEQRAAIASRNRRVSEVGYATGWAQGGPIIESEMITVGPAANAGWEASAWPVDPNAVMWGETPLIAAMRCFVQSKLGSEVEIPEEVA